MGFPETQGPFPAPMTERCKRALCIAATVASIIFASASCSSTPKADASTFCTGYIATAETGAHLRDRGELSLAEYQRQVRATDDEARDAIRSAPPDIKPAVLVISVPLHDFRKTVDKAKSLPDIDRAISVYARSTAKLTAEQRQVEVWARTHCKVSTVTTAPTTTLAGITNSGSTIP